MKPNHHPQGFEPFAVFLRLILRQAALEGDLLARLRKFGRLSRRHAEKFAELFDELALIRIGPQTPHIDNVVPIRHPILLGYPRLFVVRPL